ncbi:cupredoxin domain-containing protein [Pseudomonas sp. BMS12]|uniref:cupredoxin domain-containing protein n=1 Tax=Pseudomonas sp. BMS12 TaxID=1796033 RepID=UPI00083B5CD7|nr:cupredoxin family protein [Pseudomonas sp. BMS12]
MRNLVLCGLLCTLSLSVQADAGHDSHGAAAGHGASPFGQPAEAAKATRTVEIVLGDMYYRPASLEVQAGETVRFVLKNEGKLLHEFSLGNATSHAEHQQQMLAMQQMGHSMQHEDASTASVRPGEQAELTWTFTQAGELQFACNIPGHYQAGMVGRLQVRPNS